MDVLSFTCITPEVRRLASFQYKPLPNQQKLCISNSPAKLAKAGFMRRTDASNDEVNCEVCGVVFGDWAGESPLAVHRVLNEKCPLLTTPRSNAADDILQHPRVVSARRQLFSEEDVQTDDTGEEDGGIDTNISNASETESIGSEESLDIDESRENTPEVVNNGHHQNAHPNSNTAPSSSLPSHVSVLSSQASFSFPFEPPVGGFPMLFESRRLKTFTDPGNHKCLHWAQEGFMFRSITRDVQCVFCTLILRFHTCEPKRVHAEKSACCPRVLLMDVGNVTAADEECIKLKNLQRQLKKRSPPTRHYAICCPQYEEEAVRLGTFDNWPHSTWNEDLQGLAMSQAGFYFTGLADKVKCYSCGVGLRRWQNGADPFQQHALHMPTCPHLLSAKGEHFVQQATEQVQVLTEADVPSASASADSSGETASSPDGQLVTCPPGSPTLDVCAVTAALTTSRYPSKDILLGTLKAADENFTTVCEQRETIYQKDTALQQKDTALQQKDTALQQKDTALQQKDTALQQKDTALQQKDTALQQTFTELQQKDAVLQQVHQELCVKDEEMQAMEQRLLTQQEELEHRKRLMRYQESQIECLKIQMEALLADRRQAGRHGDPLLPPLPPAAEAEADTDASNLPNVAIDSVTCKVCLTEKINTILRPCQHVTCCSGCAHRLFNDKCPVCRAPISEYLPAYIS